MERILRAQGDAQGSSGQAVQGNTNCDHGSGDASVNHRLCAGLQCQPRTSEIDRKHPIALQREMLSEMRGGGGLA